MAKDLKITKDPENTQPMEVMEQAIIDVATAARTLLGSKLTKRAIVVLIQDSIRGNMNKATIELVLECAAELDKRYIKQEAKRLLK